MRSFQSGGAAAEVTLFFFLNLLCMLVTLELDQVLPTEERGSHGNCIDEDHEPFKRMITDRGITNTSQAVYRHDTTYMGYRRIHIDR